MEHIDITGNRYSHLVAIKRVDDYISPKGYKAEKWEFLCDCGEKIIRNKNLVTRGECCSCGCEKRKRTIEYNKKNKTKHGMRTKRIYRIWTGIKTRCFNERDNSYRLYGRRGITMCEEWRRDFINFYNWAMENGYQENLTIDRKNNNLGYIPENCRWITIKEQCRNKRNNLIFELKGERKCLSQWAEEYGFDPRKERYKIKKDIKTLEILTKGKQNVKRNTNDC